MSLYNKIIDLQKLNAAWDRAKKNQPAAGVDNITFEQFENEKRGNLYQLHMELKNHEYCSLPVKMITLYKEEKAREIALYAMRDKVVQQSLAAELQKMYENEFSGCTAAYRSGHSSLAAIEQINEMIGSGRYQYYMKLDIEHYFDRIRWGILYRILNAKIREEDVLELIRENCCGKALNEKTGELEEKKAGIYQGSGISPVLSNVYLMDFDRWLESEQVFFLRYSDDMLLLAEEEGTLMKLLQEITARLGKKGLKINGNKSGFDRIEKGFDFLGYHFDAKGKSIPAKAEQNLADRLEMMWLSGSNLSFEERVKKALEILGGWEQYYRNERVISTIFEYAAVLFSMGEKAAADLQMQRRRIQLKNGYRDITEYLAEVWRKREQPALELLEYEEYFMPEDNDDAGRGMVLMKGLQSQEEEKRRRNTEQYKEMLSHYRVCFLQMSSEHAIELMQCYTDRKEFEKARFWQEKAREADLRESRKESIAVSERVGVEQDSFEFAHTTVEKVLAAFGGREDIYSRESLGYGGKRQTETQLMPLTEEVVLDHLKGTQTIGTYIQRPNGTVRYVVIDVDVSKAFFLKYGRDTGEYTACLQAALNLASSLVHWLRTLEINGYIEYSGCRGYHVWIFFTEWIQVRYAHMLCDMIQKQAGDIQRTGWNDNHQKKECADNQKEEWSDRDQKADHSGEIHENEAASFVASQNLTVEFFPNKTRLKGDRLGQVIKIPYGVHVRTGERSYFLNKEGEPEWNAEHFIDGIAKLTPVVLKRVVAKYVESSGVGEMTKGKDITGKDIRGKGIGDKGDENGVTGAGGEDSRKNTGGDISSPDRVIYGEGTRDTEQFGPISDNIRMVLMNCSLMYYLCMKARKTAYLTHFERQSILYVFGHLGDEGKQFVHQIMSGLLNYQYHVTERFIQKIPEKPISCIKLREQYKLITAEYGCSCSFKRSKNCYPSPVLHAITRSDDLQGDVTLPVSRTVTKEKEKKFLEEMNIPTQVQELAVKVLGLKKQRRGLERSIQKVEKELERIFDSEKIDCMEVEMGLLVRRKRDNGYEWLIEI